MNVRKFVPRIRRRVVRKRSLGADRAGLLGLSLAFITLLIVAPVGLAIGAAVAFEVTGSISTPENSYHENVIGEVESGTSTAYSLGSLMPLVIAAVALIMVLIAGFLGIVPIGEGRKGE